MAEEGVAAATDDEMLSAMSALAQLITNIDLVGAITPCGLRQKTAPK
jgi:hypothetical protein